jgi:TRAP-type C4-dicarboxylate transport system substrate-binding protein
LRHGRLRIGLVGLALAALAAGCGGGDATKAGGSGPPVKLRLGTADPRGRPATRAIEEFARQVEELSDRRVRIEIAWGSANDNAPAWDQRLARRVRDGELDVGVIPARAWDTEGVTSLRALHAPFLVTADALVDQIADGPLATRMLSGLSGAGVVGLALLPEGLRHPVGFQKPLTAPGDYVGAVMRIPRSDTAYSLFRSLGAIPRDLNGDVLGRAVSSGSVRGTESSFALAGALPRAAIYTGNVTLYPKVNTLVVNRRAYDGLNDEQRDLLREAARRTVERVRGENDRQAADRLCRAGGTIVMASAADVRALERAAEPVYAELAEDPATRALIEDLRELKLSHPVASAATPAPCARRAAPGTPPQNAGGAGIPDGVYRNRLTKQDLIGAGFPASRDDPADYNGLHTMTLEGGKLTDDLRSDIPHPPDHGSYTLHGDTVDICLKADCSSGFTATWSLRDGRLVFSHIRGRDPLDTANLRAVFGAKPFTKIG